MAYVDMADSAELNFDPGVYLCEVIKAEEKKSRSGDVMFPVELRGVAPAARNLSVFDFIMLGGKGKGMGLAKLSALGIPKDFRGELRPAQIIGKRVWLFLEWDEYTDSDGKTRRNLKPDPNQGSHCGYQPESDPPEGAAVATIAKSDDRDEPLSPNDVPF